MLRRITCGYGFALAALLAAGCVPLPGGRNFTRRTVAQKLGENTLVAVDGSECRVKGDTYEKVQVGDAHACVWQDPRSDSVRVAQPGPARDPSPRRAPGRPSR